MSTAYTHLPAFNPISSQTSAPLTTYSPAPASSVTASKQHMEGRHSDYHHPQQQQQQQHQQQHQQTQQQQHHQQPDQAPPSNGPYSQGPDVKLNPAAPPSSDYGLHSASTATPARPNSQSHYPEYLTRSSYPDASRAYPNTPGSTTSSTSSMAHHSQTPNISASGHAYSPQHHYSPYGQHHDMPPQYHSPHPGMYRPEYGSPYPTHPHMPPYGHVPPNGHPLSTVYSFVPIPGTHQQKRPRRRYEEIERMYKCGWNGCEKAYGTLNHLNAHVTMQSHGQKRTPEEFKEIRKEWKARKKEEDTQRKAEEERARQQAAQQSGSVEGQSSTDSTAAPTPGGYSQTVRQLPPLGYAPAGGQVPGGYGQQPTSMETMPQYANGQMSSYYPPSPYGQGQMYHPSHSAAQSGQQEPVATDK